MMFRRLLTIAVAATFTLATFARAEINIQEVKSPAGLTAWLVEDHNIPFTALEIRFRGGASLDAPEDAGAVHLMSALLEEGAGDLDAQAFAKARDDLAASFTFRASTDTLGISARFLSENAAQAVDLLTLAINEPRFDADAVERVREQVLVSLRGDEKDPSALAAQMFDAMAYPDHPYALPVSGRIETVAGLNRDDLIAAHHASLARDRVFIAAAGDITPEALGRVIDQLLGALPATGKALPSRAPWALKGGTTLIDFPTPQSVVLFGDQGIPQSDPDFFAAYILNEVLGGGRFSARLMTEVRAKRGLTYGISSYLVGLDNAEAVMGRFSASNDKTAEAIAVVKAEWAKIAQDGITDAELATTKTYLMGGYPLRFDGNAPIASILVGMQMQGLPIDYPNFRNAKVEAVTMDDIRRVAKRLYDADRLHFVVVGQPTGLEPTETAPVAAPKSPAPQSPAP